MSWLDRLAEIRDRDWSEAELSDRRAKATEVIQISSYAAAAAAVVPVPMAELALLLPIHTAMVMTVGHVYGRPVSRTEAARVAVELGAIAGLTMAGTAALSALRKILLPGVGGVLAAPASFALTWGLGKAAIEYFQSPELSRERLQVVFKDAMKEGKSLFSRERFDAFRNRYGEGRDVVDEAERRTETPAGGAPTSEAAPEPEGSDSGGRPVSRDAGTPPGLEEPIEAEAEDESAEPEPPAGPTSRRRKRNL